MVSVGIGGTKRCNLLFGVRCSILFFLHSAFEKACLVEKFVFHTGTMILSKRNYALVVMATWDSTLLLSTMYISLSLGVYKCFIHWWQCVVTDVKKIYQPDDTFGDCQLGISKYLRISKSIPKEVIMVFLLGGRWETNFYFLY